MTIEPRSQKSEERGILLVGGVVLFVVGVWMLVSPTWGTDYLNGHVGKKINILLLGLLRMWGPLAGWTLVLYGSGIALGWFWNRAKRPDGVESASIAPALSRTSETDTHERRQVTARRVEQVAARVQQVVIQFGRIMEETAGQFYRPESSLPWPKWVVRDAILCEIYFEEHEERRGALAHALVILASYRPSIQAPIIAPDWKPPPVSDRSGAISHRTTAYILESAQANKEFVKECKKHQAAELAEVSEFMKLGAEARNAGPDLVVPMLDQLSKYLETHRTAGP